MTDDQRYRIAMVNTAKARLASIEQIVTKVPEIDSEDQQRINDDAADIVALLSLLGADC